MKAVRFGVVGLGRLGRRHAENLAWRVPGARLVAACSPVKEERDWAVSNLPELSLYADYDELLTDASIDAVWLVTPTSLHAAQIIAALRAGKHVFCEKPLSLDLAECDAVLDEHARHPHLQVMIGFVRRFDASYRDAFERIEADAIGRPFMVRSQTCDKNDPDGFFVRFAPTSGGLFLDCSVHDIDLARWLLGNPQPKRVYASGTVAIHEGLRDCNDIDNGVGVVEFEGGKLAVFYASRTMAHGHDTQTEVIGTAGALSVGRNPRANRVEIADAQGIRHACTPTFFERFEDAFLREAQAFVASLKDGTPTGLTLADAREATRIGIAMREAYESGRAVDFDPMR
jgi:myo-inositol 2-dehydrogenase / D-chiro-inositol 1-dehydrogenase